MILTIIVATISFLIGGCIGAVCGVNAVRKHQEAENERWSGL